MQKDFSFIPHGIFGAGLAQASLWADWGEFHLSGAGA